MRRKRAGLVSCLKNPLGRSVLRFFRPRSFRQSQALARAELVEYALGTGLAVLDLACELLDQALDQDAPTRSVRRRAKRDIDGIQANMQHIQMRPKLARNTQGGAEYR